MKESQNSRSTKPFIHGAEITETARADASEEGHPKKEPRGLLHPQNLPRRKCSCSSPVGSCHPLRVNSLCWHSSPFVIQNVCNCRLLLCVPVSAHPGCFHRALCPLLIKGWQFTASCLSLGSHPELNLHPEFSLQTQLPAPDVSLNTSKHRN